MKMKIHGNLQTLTSNYVVDYDVPISFETFPKRQKDLVYLMFKFGKRKLLEVKLDLLSKTFYEIIVLFRPDQYFDCKYEIDPESHIIPDSMPCLDVTELETTPNTADPSLADLYVKEKTSTTELYFSLYKNAAKIDLFPCDSKPIDTTIYVNNRVAFYVNKEEEIYSIVFLDLNEEESQLLLKVYKNKPLPKS